MLLKTHFKKLRLVQHVQSILKIDDKPHLICIALLTSCTVSQAFAQDTAPKLQQSNTQTLASTTIQQDLGSTLNSTDSLQLLQQQQQNPTLTDFKPVNLGELEQLPEIAVDPSMAQQILNEAAQAKQQAETNRQQGMVVNSQMSAQTMQTLTETTMPPVQVNQIINNIQTAHDQDLTQARANDANSQAKKGAIFNDTTFEIEQPTVPEKNIFKRWFNRLKPNQNTDSFVIPKITAEVQGAPLILETNIKNKLSTFTQEAFEDESSALPQLRAQVQQAAQAVGYYNAKFKFERLSNKKVKVIVEPNQPVLVDSQNIEFLGAGKNLAQFQIIRLLPDLEVGDILNQGKYEKTKLRITDVASDNGYFDAYWRLHDLKVQLPENKADINLKYDTGERYKLGNVEFRMSDSKKPFPLRMSVLKSMVPWQSGDDYAFWRVNTLANNLTNSRYFNWSLVETVKPDPISKPQELPPDIQALVNEQKITQTQAQSGLQDTSTEKTVENKAVSANEPVKKQTIADEKQFAGAQDRTNQNTQADVEQVEDINQQKEQVRKTKQVPVIVTLNADKLNSAEVGIGYGTDTGIRLRTQYRRAIVNSYGHSFDANMELSQIRQAVDTHYTIPYKHPINDYFNLVSGYEREEFTGVGPGMSLTTETAIAGAERVIRNPFGGWQQTFGFRYRLDKIHQIGDVDEADVPSAFLRPGSNPQQQALLFGYQISRTDSNDPLNPVKGFKQSYKLQLGSKSVISDANMAILSADWAGIYSLGKNYNHQFVASAQMAYIFTDDFDHVPYNLRFFAGGDQSLRGFDYKSLSPEEGGYKIGGQALAVGSLEYNYQFKEGWRAAAFTDVGNAYNKDFSNPIAYSVGVGIRWRSPIGPIRLDIASGISDPGHPIRLHFFIGSQL
ncbi:autotransporter assembly complex protein TamA [Acinetobacter boissieri]|uniref:Translocation and assembly module subunit TamA n=1 Tax=Acinetobacter boissieri TaxID=1219383 RepID=A0A1G6I9M7_9GAMM|nr:autotransporter assembly complex family protein [Acinetobacter boissieri]SDC03138.1 autotransporter secretion outer membrane protein TamA [Acinetobacter boissieri]